MSSSIRDLKRILASMRGRIDQVFTAAEKRKLLKDISTGKIGDGNALRAYIGRVEGIKRKKVKEQTATLSGKVIDASGRTPLGGVDVAIQQTSFKEKTDTSGNFIWDNLIKGRSIRINTSLSGYKPNITDFQAAMDNEQFVVIKMVEIQGAAQARQKAKQQKGKE